ncbi:hypothetical protein [Candidatus Korobacter versatilis]|uniref:hypothetical protein n=1 Tax=Candidatus Korobacter versatilis TaxID=658062 RepID=UPI0011D04523|nr:hypothetical protein [Candidatus Koribacter versatilis]
MSFELTHIGSYGGPYFPVLTISSEVALNAFRDRIGAATPAVCPLTLMRIVGELRSPDHRTVARFEHNPMLRAERADGTTNGVQTFSIPLDLSTIDQIERSRGPGDLQVMLNLLPIFAIHMPNAAVIFEVGRIEGLKFPIPRSQWVDNLLPGLGYGGLEILEVRYASTTIGKHLQKSVGEIRDAKKALLDGDCHMAVLHCRRSVEALLESGSSALPPSMRFQQKVETWISDNFKTVDGTEAKLLAEQMQVVWEVTSAAAHSGSSHSFKARESEFLIRTAMNIVEYVNRLS